MKGRTALSCSDEGVAHNDALTVAEIKKAVYWDLDKRLRIEARINLWPSATGDAPVQSQRPTDEVCFLVLLTVCGVLGYSGYLSND
jgi:hypothetical protein